MLGGLDNHGGCGNHKVGRGRERVIAVQPYIDWDVVLLPTKVDRDRPLHAYQGHCLPIFVGWRREEKGGYEEVMTEAKPSFEDRIRIRIRIGSMLLKLAVLGLSEG